MPSVEQLRTRLVDKLRELFQLDQPDLDFGFWRIMHARAKQVTEFIENDLLKIVEEAFREGNEDRVAERQTAYETALAQAKEFGAPAPENAPAVQKARAVLEAARDTTKAEADIYDHLYRFFERYYDNGDFISRRYYTRETAGKAAPYAVPYDGSEVYLHWANADQYYIKTAEFFSNLTFDLSQAQEVRAHEGELFAGREAPESRRVHFRVVEASEGEHGNVKASEQTTRYFIVHKDDPVGLDENGELVCLFEFRPDPEKTGQEGTWRDKRNAEAVETIINALTEMAKTNERAAEYLRLLSVAAPTEKQKDRPILAKYVNQYTARNTMDYFIHKDLGGFLRRELDFYIKNEVVRLDDIESAEAPRVEQYLDRVRVLRRIAQKLIDFLAQLEEFQKKLWLKKKFVVETGYCITLDHVFAVEQETERDWLIQQIVDNDRQREEWVRLYAIDEIKGDLHTPEYSVPLSDDFLKANPLLVLDTALFSEDVTQVLLSSVHVKEAAITGCLIHGDNFQALNLIGHRYMAEASCVYLDPPFNTTENGFIYKNAYQHSSWCSMVSNCLLTAWPLLGDSGVVATAIDDFELHHLGMTCDACFGIQSRLGVLVVEIKPSGRTNDNYLATSHEYYLLYSPNPKMANIVFFPLSAEQKEQYGETDDQGAFKWRDFLRTGGFSTPRERPNSYYPIYYDPSTQSISLQEQEGWTAIWPIDTEGRKRVWRKTRPSFETHLAAGEIRVTKRRDDSYKVEIIDRIKTGIRPKSVWTGKRYDAASHGTKLLKAMFGEAGAFSFPKSVYATRDVLYVVVGEDQEATVVDFFAGSGTTGDALFRLNREDDGSRRFILVELGDHFDSALLPRIKKSSYADQWKDGKPTVRDAGLSQIMKYVRLESYEDCLNNLVLPEDLPPDDPRSKQHGEREKALGQNPELREDFILRYMLDVETRGSQSLLNIDAFADPTAYKLKVKKPGSDEYVWKNVDLLETFNYLIGLRVEHIAVPQTFAAEFKRERDPDLPQDTTTRLALDGRMRQDADGPWWFRRVEGWVPGDPNNPTNGERDRVLVIWRKLTGDVEKDNLMLDEYMKSLGISTQDFEYDTIYVNGTNNLPNLRRAEDTWKVRLIEEDFHRLMWDVSDV